VARETRIGRIKISGSPVNAALLSIRQWQPVPVEQGVGEMGFDAHARDIGGGTICD
jgi:hypothetical protein